MDVMRGSMAFCLCLLSVAVVVSQITVKNVPFYLFITILTYFSTSLHANRYIKQQSRSGLIGVCAVRVGFLFVVAERWFLFVTAERWRPKQATNQIVVVPCFL